MTDGEHDEYQVLLRAFGYRDLPLYDFEGPFYFHIPAWDDQGPLDQELMLLLHERDQVSDIEKRRQIETKMRAVVREHLGAD